MAQVWILMENKTPASSQALQSLYAKPSGALLSRGLAQEHHADDGGFVSLWQSLARAGWAAPPGSGCSPTQEAGTGHGGGAWPPICSTGHSHEAERFTCNVQRCRRPPPRQWVNLTFGHSSAWAGWRVNLGWRVPPLLTTRITQLNTCKAHLCPRAEWGLSLGQPCLVLTMLWPN